MARQRSHRPHRPHRPHRSQQPQDLGGNEPADSTSDFPPTPPRRSTIHPPEQYPKFIPDIDNPPILSLLGPMAEVAQIVDGLRDELRRMYENLKYGQNYTNHQIGELRAVVLQLANRVDRLGAVVDELYLNQNQREFDMRGQFGSRNGGYECVSTGVPGPAIETIYSGAENSTPVIPNLTPPQTFTAGNNHQFNGAYNYVAQPNYTFPPRNPQNEPHNVAINSGREMGGITDAWTAQGGNSKSSGKDDEWMLPGEKLNGGVNEEWMDETSNVSFGRVGVDTGAVRGEGEGSTRKKKVVDGEALKADLLYSVGECAGMLKMFGRLAKGPTGVTGAMEATGRDMYRALRAMEKNMEKAREFDGKL